MKKITVLFFFATIITSLCAQNINHSTASGEGIAHAKLNSENSFPAQASGNSFRLKTNMDTISYSVGVLIAQNLKSQGMDKVDAASLADAVTDVFAGNELKIPQEKAGAIFQSYMKDQSEKVNEGKIAAGKAYLAENATKEGVTVTESGLQYEVINAGVGVTPGTGDKVTVHYEGTLIDGTVFDSSYKRGQPATFGVTQVIPGWVEALQLMKPGDKWKLTIPQDLAYGERGAPPSIPPFSALIFTVELIGINK